MGGGGKEEEEFKVKFRNKYFASKGLFDFIFSTLHIFLHLTGIYSCTFGVEGWRNLTLLAWMLLVVLAYMYALCVSGAVNTQGFVWKFLCAIHKCSFIHSV